MLGPRCSDCWVPFEAEAEHLAYSSYVQKGSFEKSSSFAEPSFLQVPVVEVTWTMAFQAMQTHLEARCLRMR